MSDAYVAEDPLADTSSAYVGVPGYQWGSTNGDQNDWSQGTMGILDWTIELRSDTVWEWDFHLAGFKNFVAYAFIGLEGLVTDAETGTPLHARLETDPRGTHFFTDPQVGDYHRVISPGTYAITAYAQGYKARTQSNVVISEGTLVTVDFALSRIAQGAPRYAFALAEMRMPGVIRSQYP